MIIKLILLSSVLLFSTLKANVISVHCHLGCPSNPEKNSLVFGHLYAFSNNPETKFADWVAYKVDVVNFGDSPGRKWKSEPLLDKNDTLEADDYKGASASDLKSDRGHQAPLASFAGSRHWSELNHLSNITPQHKDLNQGPWKDLEDAVRGAAAFRKPLHVITGPIYEGESLTLPKADESHRVPNGYFKVVYDSKGNSVSFLMMQEAGRNDSYCSKLKPFSEIQSKVRFSMPAFTDSAVIAQKLGCQIN